MAMPSATKVAAHLRANGWSPACAPATWSARLGGDEFVVLVDDALLPEAAEIIARKLIATMDVDIIVDGIHVHATTSIGIAYCPFRTSAEVLMAAADAALYAAKKAGRNTCRW